MNTTKLDSLALWHLIILNEGTTFATTGRGSRPGIEFTYEISRSRRAADITTLERAYPATATSCGLSLELANERKNPSLAPRVTWRTGMQSKSRKGKASFPARKLGVPGVRSNLYAMFVKFGVISSDHGETTDVGESNATADENESVAADAE